MLAAVIWYLSILWLIISLCGIAFISLMRLYDTITAWRHKRMLERPYWPPREDQ
jgi:hypothetical protein